MRFETKLLAQDRDTTRVSTARQLVSDLVDADVVTAVAGLRVLVHEPSGEAFDSMQQIAAFHRGWSAVYDAGEADE